MERGSALGTRGRARMWCSTSDDGDDDEMSDGEEEEPAENSRRERCTTVEQLRRDDMAAIERQNAADYATIGPSPEPATSTFVRMGLTASCRYGY